MLFLLEFGDFKVAGRSPKGEFSLGAFLLRVLYIVVNLKFTSVLAVQVVEVDN